MLKPDCTICTLCMAQVFDSDIYYCQRCGLVLNTCHKAVQYDDAYFTSTYLVQYGKTYEMDFDNIYKMSLKRISHILALFKKKNFNDMAVLDIGSAMGFFLKAAVDSGAKSVTGVEISSFASNYCETKFGYKTINISFEDLTTQEKYDVITAWFFIEHCVDVFGIMKKIYSMLNNGGVFACSLPSIYGPQFVFKRKKWISEHPIDHKIDFSPKSIYKVLKSYGYRKIKIRPCGFHPERIIKKSNLLYFPFLFIYKCFTKITKFSDTIEVYAIKS